MEACSPEAANALRTDLLLVQEEINNGVVPSRTRADERCFRKWEIFFREKNIDTFLNKVRDPVPFLQIFIRRVRSGLLAHNMELVRSRTAEAYLRAVGQTFANVGIDDPASTSTGALTTGSNDSSEGGQNQMPPRSGSNPSTSD